MLSIQHYMASNSFPQDTV